MQKDVFDYIDPDDERGAPDRSGIVWNVLTFLVLFITLAIVILVVTVFINPNTFFNPFPPPTLPVRMMLDTATPTPVNVLPPTWTPVIQSSSTPTEIPEATLTPEAIEDEQGIVEEGEEIEITGDMPVVLHDGSPQYIPSTSFHPDLGCNWLGVAGQVIDINGAPVLGLIIEVGGLLDGKRVGNPTLLQATGLATAYGDAGFEVKLADEPIASEGTVWIQVLDQAGLPLSQKIEFDTYQDCERNLVVIYFKQIR